MGPRPMIPFVCQWIDRTAINYAAAHMPEPDGRDLRLDEAHHLLQSPDFFPIETKAPVIEFDGRINFRFASPRPTAHAVNNVVHGRLFRCDDHWRQKPVALLLHGWNDVLNHRFLFPRYARHLNQLGISAATLQLPWHFDRRPRELGAWGNFLSADILRTVESTLQALAEIRSFVNWLTEQSCPFVGLWGISLGGWLVGLTLCHDARIGCAVLTVPAARLDRIIEDTTFCETIRCVLQQQRVDLRKLNLESNRPATARKNILLIEAEYDLFVDKETVEDLWRAWDKPEIWRFRHGHISVLCAPGLSKRVARWIAARAGEHASK
jgi:dienelactone hydrolase